METSKSVALVAAGGGNEGNESEIALSTLSASKYTEESRILLPDEELMTREQLPRKHPCFYGISYVILILSFPILIALTILIVEDHETYFIERGYNTAIIVGTTYITGAVFKKYLQMRTCYTRKIIHLTFFALPLILDAITNELQDAFLDALWATWATQAMFGMAFTIPVRELSNKVFGNPTKPHATWSSNALTYCNICELSIDALDRPEDRPNTLLWAQTQLLLTYVCYAILGAVFQFDTDTPM